MAHLVGANLTIPGDAWVPPEEGVTIAQVVAHSRGTRLYPLGRVRLICDDGTDVWWDVTKLPDTWITGMAAAPAAPPPAPTTTPRKRGTSTTRRASASKPGAEEGAAEPAGPQPAVTPASTVRSRSRTRRSSARAPADGNESAGAGVLSSDGEGAAPSRGTDRRRNRRSSARAPMSPSAVGDNGGDTQAQASVPPALELLSGDEGAAPRRSTRPRKSLRFAPGTYSPTGTPAAASAGAVRSPGKEDPAAVPFAGGVTSPLNLSCTAASPASAGKASGAGSASSDPYATYMPAKQCWDKNARNFVLMMAVALPAAYFLHMLHHVCTMEQLFAPLGPAWSHGLASLVSRDAWCALGYQQPLLAVNAVYFLLVDVGFWLVGLLQGNFWLIDPYWQLIPVLIASFYQFHPRVAADPLRSNVSMALLWLWALRMLHSYFRRENWQFGARQDWRYERMARKMGPLTWALVSFWAVCITQHLMLVGLTLPFLAVHTSTRPWDPLADTAITLLALTGMALGTVADNELRAFMLDNEERVAQGREPVLLLNTGLWRLSRHPNHFGEQLWWWAVGLWAVLCGQSWMLVGAVFNTAIMVEVTRMVEKRMLSKPARAQLFRHYQKTTSCWVPWFHRSDVDHSVEAEGADAEEPVPFM